MATASLDIEQPAALIAYLRHTRRIDATETPALRVLAGGVSNRTVLVERANGDAWVIKQALPKLRVAVDWFSDPLRIHREAQGLRWLAELIPPGATPALIFEDHDAHLLAMSAVPEPHTNWKTLLLAGGLRLAQVEQFAELLGAIHAKAYARRAELAPLFADRSIFESLRLEPYYHYTASQVPEATAFLTDLIAATRAHALTLTHGDYSPKNVLVYRERLVLLDHEVIHWGDPGFDLGFALTHLLGKAHHLPTQRPDFAAAARRFWQCYGTTLADVEWREPLEARAVRHTLACLLARVAGRSPLEYLNSTERQRQRRAVLALMAESPLRINELIAAFITHLDLET